MIPPASGPATAAPATKNTKWSRRRRSGVPLHQASTSEAPTSGSTEFATAKPRAPAQPTPYRRSTANSASTIAATTTGHSERRDSSMAATVTPAAGKNAGPMPAPNVCQENTAPVR